MRGFVRLAAAILLAAAVVPTAWLRTEQLPLATADNDLVVTPLPAEPEPARTGPVTLRGVWQLSSSDRRFGEYSGLAPLPGGWLRAQSDSARYLEMTAPGILPPRHHYGSVQTGAEDTETVSLKLDAEGITRDPETGRVWLSIEEKNTIRRYEPDGSLSAVYAPPAMRDFQTNGGAEALVRLADGRFVALEESGRWPTIRRRTGLLFPGDPTDRQPPTRFSLVPPLGYDPTDAALLPDGRVAILLRGIRFAKLPYFSSLIIVADPADIRPGEAWRWRKLLKVGSLAPRENYEGLAVVPEKAGIALWLISDANRSVLIQRTLLVKLLWQECPGNQAAGCASIRQPRQKPS